jgi:hypothetical protein
MKDVLVIKKKKKLIIIPNKLMFFSLISVNWEMSLQVLDLIVVIWKEKM